MSEEATINLCCRNLVEEERDSSYQQCHTPEERSWPQLWEDQHFMDCHPGHKCGVGVDRALGCLQHQFLFSQVLLLLLLLPLLALLLLLFIFFFDKSEQSFRDWAVSRPWLWTSASWWDPWDRIQSPHTQRSGRTVSRTRGSTGLFYPS